MRILFELNVWGCVIGPFVYYCFEKYIGLEFLIVVLYVPLFIFATISEFLFFIYRFWCFSIFLPIILLCSIWSLGILM